MLNKGLAKSEAKKEEVKVNPMSSGYSSVVRNVNESTESRMPTYVSINKSSKSVRVENQVKK